MKNIQPPYYSAHAYDFFTESIKKEAQLYHLYHLLSDKEKPILINFMEGLKRCPKYLLPKDNEIGYEVKEYEKHIQILKLPHENLIMEIPISVETDKPGCIGISKRIVFLMNSQDLSVKDGFTIATMEFCDPENVWTMSPILISFDRTTNEVSLEYLFPDLIDKYWKDIEGDEITRKSINSIFYDVIDFLCALNCTNVGKQIIKEPKKLSKARVKRGAMPMYEYHVLDIHLNAIGSQFNILRTDKRGVTPRLHVCRGHYKQLKTGLYWWTAHMRGKKELGVIEKDYRVVP